MSSIFFAQSNIESSEFMQSTCNCSDGFVGVYCAKLEAFALIMLNMSLGADKLDKLTD